jgi:hypothetical protein
MVAVANLPAAKYRMHQCLLKNSVVTTQSFEQLDFNSGSTTGFI